VASIAVDLHSCQQPGLRLKLKPESRRYISIAL